MAVISDITVNVALSQPVSELGFGVPLIFEGLAAAAIPYTLCTGLEEVQAAIAQVTSADTDEQAKAKMAAALESPVYQAALLVFMQNNAPSQVAVYASADPAVTALPNVIRDGWRQLIVTSFGRTQGDGDDAVSESTPKAVSTYIETTSDKLFFWGAANTAAVTAAALGGMQRTVVFVHSEEGINNPEAAWVGAAAGYTAGTVNYRDIIIKGLTPQNLSTADVAAIEASGAACIVIKAGDTVTSDGKTNSGQYIDILDTVDWVTQNLKYYSQKVLNNSAIVRYDDTGIAQLEAAAVNVMQTAVGNGVIAIQDGEYQYTVSYLSRSQTTEADRSARNYKYGYVSFAAAGAIDTVTVNLNITY